MGKVEEKKIEMNQTGTEMKGDITEEERKKAMREIKEIRKNTGLTQKAFGKKYGIPERTIQDWETGKRKPADYVIRMLSQTIKTNISERQIFEVFDFGFEQMETSSLIPSQSDKKTIYTKDDFENGKMKKFNRYPIWKFEEEFAVSVSFR